MDWLNRPVRMKTLLLTVGALAIASAVGWSRNSYRIDAGDDARQQFDDAVEAIREATKTMNSVSQSVTLNVERRRVSGPADT
jgi:hypothetical protein